MKLNRTLAGFLAASAVALALPAQAHSRGPGHDAGGFGMFRGLQLTTEQREQVSKIFKEQEGAFKQRVEADRAAHAALRKAATDPNADIRPLADAAGKAHSEVAVLRAETVRKVLPILTPEQRSKLEQAPARGHRGHRGRH
jgi:Spy/CpxP family protein refolding chaperone